MRTAFGSRIPLTLAIMDESLSLLCNRCGRTQHTLRYQSETTDQSTCIGSTDIVFSHGQGYWLYQCNGCHHLQLGRCEWSTESDPLNWQTETKWFPHRIVKSPPSWLNRLDPKLCELLTEVYASINSGQLSLPLMGVRAAIDVFIRATVGDKGTFQKGLEALQALGSLSAQQMGHLNPVVEAGHASAHRGFIPTEAALLTAIDVLEHMLAPTVMAQSVAALERATPKRPRG
jgi:hypothetical protein